MVAVAEHPHSKQAIGKPGCCQRLPRTGECLSIHHQMALLACFLTQCLSNGGVLCIGIYYSAFLTRLPGFEHSMSRASWPTAVMGSNMFLLSPLGTAVIERWGCRVCLICGGVLVMLGYCLSTLAYNIDHLIITYGMFIGLGQCLTYLPSIVYLNIHFTKYRRVATAVAICGASLGGFLFPPLVQHLLDEYGLHGSLLINGGIAAHLIIFGALLSNIKELSPSIDVATDNKETEATLENLDTANFYSHPSVPHSEKTCGNVRCGTIVNNLVLVLQREVRTLSQTVLLKYMLLCCICHMATTITLTYICQLATTNGTLTLNNASTLISILSASSLVGRIFIGALPLADTTSSTSGRIEINGTTSPANKAGNKPWHCISIPKLTSTLMMSITCGLLGTVTLFLTLASTYWEFSAVAAAYGLPYGMIMVLYPLTAADILGAHNMASTFGYALFSCGIGGLVGPPIAGAICDRWLDVKLPFYFNSGILTITVVICLWMSHDKASIMVDGAEVEGLKGEP